MRWFLGMAVGVVLAGLAGCGVPREAGALAAQEVSLLAAAGDDDAAVKAALTGQTEAWNSLSGLLSRRELGGAAVTADFAALVEQAAALARRQKALMDAGQDDPADDRRALQAMEKMWQDVRTYLGE